MGEPFARLRIWRPEMLGVTFQAALVFALERERGDLAEWCARAPRRRGRQGVRQEGVRLDDAADVASWVLDAVGPSVERFEQQFAPALRPALERLSDIVRRLSAAAP